jgi:hypothetical protein
VTAKTAIAKAEAAQVPATESATMLHMLERLARDPSVDIERLERFVKLRNDEIVRTAKAYYLAALAEMQPKLPVIAKHGTIGMNEKNDRGDKTGKQVAMTKYARWEDVVDGIRPIMAEHGFSISFRVAQPTPDRIVVTGVLGHRDGHTEDTSMSLPIDSSGAKNNVQGWGSSVSYGKRYVAFALLNISARGEDDDGAAATEFISEKQAMDIRELIEAAEADATRFCAYLGVESITKIPAAMFDKAMNALQAKQRARGK